MSTERIKRNLIAAMDKIDDPNLLGDITKLINLGQDQDVVHLSKDHVAEIEEVIKEVEQGEFVSHEEHKNQVNEWLED